jgi:hypothetical protein
MLAAKRTEWFMYFRKLKQPNQSPEPTPIGAFSSAVAVNATNAARLSFFR